VSTLELIVREGPPRKKGRTEQSSVGVNLTRIDVKGKRKLISETREEGRGQGLNWSVRSNGKNEKRGGETQERKA